MEQVEQLRADTKAPGLRHPRATDGGNKDDSNHHCAATIIVVCHCGDHTAKLESVTCGCSVRPINHKLYGYRRAISCNTIRVVGASRPLGHTVIREHVFPSNSPRTPANPGKRSTRRWRRCWRRWPRAKRASRRRRPCGCMRRPAARAAGRASLARYHAGLIARARVTRFTSATPKSASAASHVLHAKIRLSKSRHGPKLWALPNNFAGPITFDFGQIWPYPRQNPLVAAPGAGLAGKPMGAQA